MRDVIPRTSVRLVGVLCGFAACGLFVARPANSGAADEPRGTGAKQSSPHSLTVIAEEGDPRRVVVQVTAGDPKAWTQARFDDADRAAAALQLIRAAGTTSDRVADGTTAPVPILGRHAVDGARFEFRPLLRLAAGQTYRARFLPGAVGLPGDPLEVEHRVPAPDVVPPRVERLEPTAPALPANHLKFYVQFSLPMERGGIFEHFRLDDLTAGEVVPIPFRETELWAEDDRRLTLWFHPGRQKSGVNLNVEIGPVLQPGHDYRLTVSGTWRSRDGEPLGKAFVRTFRAGPPDRTQPDPAKWRVETPRAGTRDPLVVRFGEPLDAALLRSSVGVVGADGGHVPGEITLAEHESQWRFVPQSPWTAGRHRLAVRSVLEDLAGNSVARPFEVDVTAPPPAPVAEFVHRDFDVRN